jgi:very-short-patch-repair endonuclease
VITGPRKTVKHARKLRSEMTLPEVLLWRELRKRPEGLKFRRQHPSGAYVLDFYCAAVRPAIEIDGLAHDNASVAGRDARLSESLRSQHVATLRVSAKVVLDDIDAAVTRIVAVCGERKTRMSRLLDVPLHHPADGPPPRNGEDL